MNLVVRAERSSDTCGPDVDGFSAASVVEDFGGDVAERAGEEGELVGRMEEFFSVKDEQRGWEMDKRTHMPKSTMTMSLSGSLER